ncbi:MAG: DUF3943 domain-containing protein [Bacteroidota bacterium]|nr:DUF3943 domain-containing protein [Bacteroidota bacterium]MDP4214922.1 DUF3943 domain-containing protein [Bacteroidota bacterium]MDP4246622.1 DUF3943 domain-containing protein [Bacteroidota bacterium]MDP4258849.1 DUF3943 domain-containing protein [Bacteroidota bacterium]
MKSIYLLFFPLLTCGVLSAQNPLKDTIVPSKGHIKEQLDSIKKEKVKIASDSAGNGNQPAKSRFIDTTKLNKYGDLLNDDPEFTKKTSVLTPALEVVGMSVVLNVVDRTVMHLEFANVDPHTWSRTLKAGFPWTNGWEWDQDRFGNNFLSHPMTGSFYFNAARANGFNFWQSAPIVFAGSYMWKIFGENGTPEREDLINTTVDGILLGETTYRLSSNILDDRTTGAERVFREIAAGLVDPIRGFNRLFQGKCTRRTNKEVYQKEPVNITFYAGVHAINNQTNHLLSGHNDEMLNIQLNYGNPFEVRSRKPFDFFRFRAELNFGVGRKVVDNITGYGVLLAKNYQWGKVAALLGGFQYYDYYDTKAFELSTTAFGPGLITKVPLGKTWSLYTNFHLAFAPFAGSSVGPVTDTTLYRDYRFAFGWQGKIESMINFGKIGTLTLLYYYYMIHAFDNTGKDESKVGTLGNNYISILKPRVTVHLYKNLSIGAEQTVYLNDHVDNGVQNLHFTQTEQRIFLMLYWDDPQRRQHYNL